MSLTVEETDSEQNDIRSLQAQLGATNLLVDTLSRQLTGLKDQVCVRVCLYLCLNFIVYFGDKYSGATRLGDDGRALKPPPGSIYLK